MKTTKLYQYQTEDVRRIRDLDGRCLLANEVGTGKTLTSLYYAWKFLPADPPGPIVCVVPSHLKLNWKREAQNHLGIRVEVLSGQRVPEDKHPPLDPNQVYVVNYDVLVPPHWKTGHPLPKNSWARFLKNLKPRLLIMDEAHFCKHRTAARTRACKSLAKTVPHVLALTGTPLTNSPRDLWSLLNILRPEMFPSEFEFCCLLPGTMVSGGFVRGSKAMYSGEAVELFCASGVRVSVTANHPILTPMGFVPANGLHEGDEVISDVNRVDNTVSSADEKTQGPISVEDLFSSLSIAAGGTTRLPTMPGDFHGDAFFFHDEIEVVDPKGVLRNHNQSAPIEFRHDLRFVRGSTSAGSLQSPGFVLECPDTELTTSDGVMHRSGRRQPLFATHPFESFGVGCGKHSSDGVSVFGTHPSPAEFFPFAFSSYPNPPFHEKAGESGGSDPRVFTDLAKRFPRNVSTDKIIRIRQFVHNGPVFDFQTTEGTYTAGTSVSQGMWVSNCDYTNARKRFFGWEFKGARNLDYLHRVLREQVMIRRRKCDVMSDLPPVTHSVIPVEVDLREYTKAERDFLGWLDQVSPKLAKRAAQAEQLTRLTYLKQLAAKLKLKHVTEWTNNFLEDSEGKVLLGVIHHAISRPLVEAFGRQCVLVNGELDHEQKDAAFYKFNNDPRCRILVGNLQAAGTGWNCTSSSDITIAEFPWTPAELEQFVGRAHGAGRGLAGVPVTARYLMAVGTIEEDICRSLNAKQRWAATAIDNAGDDVSLDVFTAALRGIRARAGG